MNDVKKQYLQWASGRSLPLFFQPWWLDIVSSDWRACFAEEAGMCGVWVYTVEKRMGLNIIRNPLLTPYLGPLLLPTQTLRIDKQWMLEEKLLTALLAQIKDGDSIDVMCLPTFQNFFALHQNGFKHTQRLTYHLPLTNDAATLFAKMDAKQRSAIRQAEKQLIFEAATTDTIDTFFSFHQATLTAKAQPYPYTNTLFKQLIKGALTQQQAFYQMAKNDAGETVAFVFAPYDHDTMYLLLTATNKDARHNGAAAALIWQALLFARQQGLKVFDFEGSMNKGIEQFFRSFGGERKAYLHATKHQSKLWKLREMMR